MSPWIVCWYPDWTWVGYAFKTLTACKLSIIKSTKLSSFTVQCQRFLSLIYMNMANKNQTDLFPKASQDMTGNSKDSEQNLQLLKFILIEPKSSRSHIYTRIGKLCHLQKATIYGRKGRKTWLIFQWCCVHCVKSSVHQYLQQKSIVNKQSTCFRLALNEHDTNVQKKS